MAPGAGPQLCQHPLWRATPPSSAAPPARPLCRRQVFKIPPRTGAGGWRSGEWRLGDKIFTGRCRVVALGAALEVRLEDPAT